MANESVFRDIIIFFEKLGVYDVVLPFILIFTIMFAILERTKVLGEEQGKRPRTNLNAMVAFVTAFFVVASIQIVTTLKEAMGHIALLVVIGISYLLLIGVFFKKDEEVQISGWGRSFILILMFFLTVIVFLNAIKDKNGNSWLSIFWDFMINNWQTNYMASLILIIFIIAFMYWVTKDESAQKKEEKK